MKLINLLLTVFGVSAFGEMRITQERRLKTSLHKTIRRQNALRKAVARIQRLKYKDDRISQYIRLREIVRRWDTEEYSPANNQREEVMDTRRNRFESYHLD